MARRPPHRKKADLWVHAGDKSPDPASARMDLIAVMPDTLDPVPPLLHPSSAKPYLLGRRRGPGLPHLRLPRHGGPVWCRHGAEAAAEGGARYGGSDRLPVLKFVGRGMAFLILQGLNCKMNVY
jgi:hypothetical protein